ncbi:hypothetical protein BG006_003189, partial [Podila minutissima]
MDMNEGFQYGQAVKRFTGHDEVDTNGAGGCAVAIAGVIACAVGLGACIMTTVPATIIGCDTMGVRSWLTGLIVSGIAGIIVECKNMGSDFNGHKFAVECTVAQYIVFHPPPNGVPADVRSFYKKQCSD